MPSPPPPITPFIRNQIRDGLLINAEIWQQAHHYHRQRQNFHYQATYEPGIICGLGVAKVEAPPALPAAYRDGRWLQVKPGIAIDAVGNPIIVTEPQTFHIESDPASQDGALLVYLVVNYVDPDDLRQEPNRIRRPETFRIVEKVSLDIQDIELCRMHLGSGAIELSAPDRVYAPLLNQLDLRHRCWAQPKKAGTVRVAQVLSTQEAKHPSQQARSHNWHQLLRAVNRLSPSVAAKEDVAVIDQDTLAVEALMPFELVALQWSKVGQLDAARHQALGSYLNAGGTILLSVSFEELELLPLIQIWQELQSVLQNRSLGASTDKVEQLHEQSQAIAHDIQAKVNTLLPTLTQWVQQWNYALQGSGQLEQDHPLRQDPFLFSQLPEVEGFPILIQVWEGVVLMVGDLTVHWGISEPSSVPLSAMEFRTPRETIRTAQEFGINLLHFAWHRSQMHQQLQPLIEEQPDPTPPDSLTAQVESQGP